MYLLSGHRLDDSFSQSRRERGEMKEKEEKEVISRIEDEVGEKGCFLMLRKPLLVCFCVVV